mgnify:CR=1 FL=1
MIYKRLVEIFATKDFWDYVELSLDLHNYRSNKWTPLIREAGEKLILNEMDKIWNQLNWLERLLINRWIKYALLPK